MTVRECLEFAAKLKLPGTLASKQERVETIIKELRLTKAQSTKIGGPLVKGVSGGERKRTSIGVELITDPSLIFLDEPTTGLDSFTATSVMELLRTLAGQGRTVIQTIHQPNSDMFGMMDQLMLLARGRVIYLNEASKAVDYFASISDATHDYRCPEMSNPADYFMKVMSIESIEVAHDSGKRSVMEKAERDKMIADEYHKRVAWFAEKYETSELFTDATKDRDAVPAITEEMLATNHRSSWCYQFQLLFGRNFNNIIRLPITGVAKIVMSIVVSLFCVMLFYDVGDDLPGVQTRNGALFFITMN